MKSSFAILFVGALFLAIVPGVQAQEPEEAPVPLGRFIDEMRMCDVTGDDQGCGTLPDGSPREGARLESSHNGFVFKSATLPPNLYRPRTVAGQDASYPEFSERVYFDVNLTNDLDSYKLAAGAYQTFWLMADSYSNEATARDAFLDQFSKLLTIGQMTLQYLDKTVGAGLAGSWKSIYDDVQTTLMEQLTMSNDKIANPHESHVYYDTRRKIEGCMYHFYIGGAAQSHDSHEFHPDDYECSPPVAATDPLFFETICPQPLDESHVYRYCLCCAKLSKLGMPGQIEGDTEGNYSLVRRVMWGAKEPDDFKGDRIVAVEHYVRSLYGDRIHRMPIFDIGGQISGGYYKKHYHHPKWSLHDGIAVLMEGDAYPNGDPTTPPPACENLLGGEQGSDVGLPLDPYDGFLACPFTGAVISDRGACDGLRWLVDQELPSTPPPDEESLEYQENYALASLGGVMDRRTIKALAQMEPLERARAEQLVCQEIGRRALRLTVNRFESIVIDAMTMNSRLTEEERQDMSRLMARVQAQLDIADRDVASGNALETLVVQVNMEHDRKKIARHQNNAVAMSNSQNTTQQLEDMSSFAFGATPRALQGLEGAIPAP